MFSIAWVVVQAETEGSWSWFLTLLFTNLREGKGKDWTFVSIDRRKYLTYYP